MSNEHYGTKLLMYQLLIAVPSEVLLLEVYDKLTPKDPKSHLAMAALNLGSIAFTLGASKGLYNIFHKADPKSNLDTRYLSPLTEYAYRSSKSLVEDTRRSERASLKAKLEKLRASENTFSETYMESATTLYGLKTGYGTYHAPYKNILAKALYGASQPISVILKDSGTLK